MQLKNYLAFENALESIKYYEENFGATLVSHMPLTEDLVKQFGLETTEGSTFSATLKIFGLDFQLSDRVDYKDEFSKNVNIMVEFTSDENDKFIGYTKSLKEIEVLYSNIDENDAPYRMFRFIDKYGIIWALVIV